MLFNKRSPGYSIIELIVVVAVVGSIVGLSIAAFRSLQSRLALVVAVREVRDALAAARSRALAQGIHTGVKFRKVGADWDYAMYDDGDFDGVRNDDIVKGIDRLASNRQYLLRGSQGASIGFPNEKVMDPDLDKPINYSGGPIRFNASTLCSFSPMGGATPGSVFLTDDGERAAVVRVYGPTGRIRVMVYDRGAAKWRIP